MIRKGDSDLGKETPICEWETRICFNYYLCSFNKVFTESEPTEGYILTSEPGTTTTHSGIPQIPILAGE